MPFYREFFRYTYIGFHVYLLTLPLLNKNPNRNIKAQINMSNDLEESLKTIAKGGAIIFIGMIIGNVIGLFFSILCGRFLGIELYGQYNLALSIISILETIALFGLIGSLPRFIPFHLRKREKDAVKSTIRFSMKFVLCTSLTIGLILFLISPWLATNIFHQSNLGIVLRCLAIGLPFLALTDTLSAIIRGFKEVKYQVIIYQVGNNAVKLTIFILLFLIGYRLFGAIFAYLGAIIFTFFVAYYIIRKKIFQDYSDYNKIPIGNKLLSFTWPLGITAIVSLLISKTDVILIGYYLNTQDVGIYAAALTIASLLNIISTAFAYIFLPVVSGLFGKGEMTVLNSIFKSASKWMFLIVFPMLLYILLFSKEIITLLYGANYSIGYLAFIILAIGTSLGNLTGFTGSILVGSGRTKLNLLCEVVPGLCNVIFNITLIPRFGIIGAAIGNCSAYSIRTILFVAFVYKATKMQPFTKDYYKIILIGFLLLGLIYFLKSYIVSYLYFPVSMILLGLVLLCVYIGSLLITHSLDINDKIILRVFMKKLGLKLNFFRKFI